MKYLALDVETTGLNPQEHQVLELALVVEDTAVYPLPPVDKLTHLVVRFKHETIRGEAQALVMNQDLLAQMSAATPWLEAWRRVEQFVVREFPEGRAVVAGQGAAGFDLRFFPGHLLPLFHHRVIDVGSRFVDFKKHVPPGLQDLLDRPQKHRALPDARAVVEILRRSYT